MQIQLRRLCGAHPGSYQPGHPEYSQCIGTGSSVSLKQIAADTALQAAFEQRAGAMMAPVGPLKFGPGKSFHEQVSYMISRRDEFDLVKYADKLKNRKTLFITGWYDMTTLMEENVLPLYRKLHSLGATGISIEVFNTTHRYPDVRQELADAIRKWQKRTQE